MVLDVSEIMTERLEFKSLFLSYDPEELSSAQLNVNRGLFCHSVLGNMLNHALNRSPARSVITLRYKKLNRFHEIIIIDLGPALPTASLLPLRDPLTHELSHSFGLMIALQVTELHGGTLDLTNTHPGASITVRLPV